MRETQFQVQNYFEPSPSYKSYLVKMNHVTFGVCVYMCIYISGFIYIIHVHFPSLCFRISLFFPGQA